MNDLHSLQNPSVRSLGASCAALLAAAVVGGATPLAASAGAADPSTSTVEPWDGLGFAFVTPGNQSGVDDVTVTLRDSDGAPVAGAPIEIHFEDCPNTCVDAVSQLSGFTDDAGMLTLNPRVGGCGPCAAVRVSAEGRTLRTFDSVRSTDWDGAHADGTVGDADSGYFESVFLSSAPCGDLDGDGTVNTADLLLLNASFGEAMVNPCRTLDVEASRVEPWDFYGQALVSPGTSGSDLVFVKAVDSGGAPIEGAAVRLRFDYCSTLCYDSASANVTAITNADGEAELDPAVGGCDVCEVLVYVNSVFLRRYERVVSLDWSGAGSDGLVNDEDVGYFESILASGEYDECVDYNGDGQVNLDDLTILGNGFGDANGASCVVSVPEADGLKPLVLLAPRPNPARGALTFPLVVDRDGAFRLEVFDVSGRRVAGAADGRFAAGAHLIEWNPADARLAAGTYFVRLTTEAGSESRRFALIR